MANDFLPLGTGAGSNVITQAAWVALAARLTGFQAGTAKSNEVNKALRQATFGVAGLAQFMEQVSGLDVLDDASLANFEAGLRRAVRAFGGGYFGASGTANAITITPSPAFTTTSQLVGVPLRVVAGFTNTGAVTLNVNGLGAIAVQRRNGAPLSVGDIVVGQIFQVIFNGTIFQLVTQLETFFQTQAFGGSGQAGVTTTLVVPTGVTRMFMRVWGAGGGGGGAAATNSAGGGGGGGGYAENWFPVLPGATLNITAGTGGNGGGVSTTGTSGTSSFVSVSTGPVTGTLLVASGGAPGVGALANAVGAGGAGGGTAGGAFSPGGMPGEAGIAIASSVYGGRGGAAPLAGPGGFPGAQGQIFGAGGGGGWLNIGAAGNGAGGLVVISW